MMKKTIAFHDEYFRNENFYFFVLIDKINVFLFSYPFSLSLESINLWDSK